MSTTRLDLLLQRYFDGELSPAEKQELEELLLSDSRARKEFWLAARTHASLRLWGEAQWGRAAAGRPAAPESLASISWWEALGHYFRRPMFWAAGTAAVAAISFLLFALWSEWSPEQGPVAANPAKNAVESPLTVPAAASRGIAVLKLVADVAWARGAREYQPGDTLVPGWLRLQSGAVQIEFARGACVVLEGPADFELVSSEECHLRFGRVRAHVPAPASGFRVTSAGFDLVDYGTEFGCQVPAEGQAEVYVFQGAVEVSPRRQNQAKRTVRANQAVAVTANGFEVIPVTGGAFLGEAELARREQSDFSERLANWRSKAGFLSEHSNMVLHYTFEGQQGWERTVRNGARGALRATDATIVGCNWAQGRWPGKSALEFIRTDDRLRVNVPGEFQCLTFLAWLRVDSLPNHYTSLAMTESLEVGEVHWSINQPGGLMLSARKVPPTSPADWETATVWGALKPEMSGTWVMVASVYDPEVAAVSHFINGAQIARCKVQFPAKLKLGNLEIGNWGVRRDDPRWERLKRAGSVILNRSFKGRMDEFALLSTALSAEEIRAIYDYGKPVSCELQVAGLPPKPNTIQPQ